MKKVLRGLFIFIAVIFLVACGSGNKESTGGTGSSGESGSSGDDNEIQELTIKFSHVVAENTPKHQGALAMKEYIEEASGGKIKVEVYPNSSLFGDQDEYQNLVANNVQFIAPDLSKFVGQNPQFNIPSLPFAFDNDEAAIAFWDSEKGQEVLGSLIDDGVIGLYMWPNGGKHVTNDKVPIRKPEDFQGLKFRTQGGQMLESIYSMLGAGSETIPFGELYTALDQGVVDGQENTMSNIESRKFDEVQKYLTILNHTRVDYAVFTNVTFWESLNEPTKKIIEEGLRKGTEVARSQAKQLNDEAFEKLKERGLIEIIELTPEEIQVFRDLLQPIWDEYEDVIGSDVYEAVRKANEEFGNN